VGIYNSFDYSDLGNLLDRLKKVPGEKKAYIFTFDSTGLNPNDFIGWEGIEIEPIPQKIIELLGTAYVD
jgi:hypothetical protein